MFTFNDWSSGTEYDQMVKAAVTSAIDVARMKAFCMYSGSEDSCWGTAWRMRTGGPLHTGRESVGMQ